MLTLFLSGEFFYTSRAAFIFIQGVSLTHPVLVSFFFFFFLFFFLKYLGSFLIVSLTRPVLASFLSGEFLLHIPCWLHFSFGSFSYTSRAGFIFVRGLSLTHTVMDSFVSGKFLLHFPCWLYFSVGVSVTHPMLASFWNLGSFSYTSRAGFIFIWGISLKHPVMTSFLCGEFLLHVPS